MDHEEFFRNIAGKFNSQQLQYVQKAYWLAKEVHRTQTRRLTGERYFEHVRRVANLVIQYGYIDYETITLAILHDVIEDTFTPPNVIVDLFGSKMYTWILSLSKEIPIFHPVTGKVICRAKVDTQEYYDSLLNGSKPPKIVKCCDRLDNIADLHLWEPQRQEKYILETRTYSLPLVQLMDVRIAKEIENKLTQIGNI